MEQIAVIGAGYVGLVLGACLAESGHRVTCVDIDPAKVEALRRGEVPIHEDGLTEIVLRNTAAGTLRFTSAAQEAIQAAQIVFIAVGTPEDRDGSADLRFVLDVARAIGRAMDGPKIVVCKSTVPVGTCRRVREVVARYTSHPVQVVSNPEFLREGSAVADFRCPDRVVIGADDEAAGDTVAAIYETFVGSGRIVRMSVQSAEMTKYAANSLLATKISFINEIANICERVGADVEQVRMGIGLDHRIGPHFIRPGVGYGGSCFPKDVRALIRISQEHGFEPRILKAVDEVNARQKLRLFDAVQEIYPTLKDRTVAVWGLAFKPKTDDVREAPALDTIRALVKRGVQVRAYDPVANSNARRALFDLDGAVRFFDDPYEAIEATDALFLFTEWDDFDDIDLQAVASRMHNPVILDGRNVFDAEKMAAASITYISIGRPSTGQLATYAQTA